MQICNHRGDIIEDRAGGLAGDGPPFEFKTAGAGDNVLRCATLDGADVEGRVCGIEEAVLVAAQPGSEVLKVGEEPAPRGKSRRRPAQDERCALLCR